MKANDIVSIVPVVLAGGEGSRLWPMSRVKKPKQFCSIAGEGSATLFDKTLDRLEEIGRLSKVKKYYVVTGEKYKNQILSSKAAEKIRNNLEIVLEPSSRNTAASMTLVAMLAEDDDVLVMLPSDHDFDEKMFVSSLLEAVVTCDQNDAICLIGISATRPETGYGYIQVRGTENARSYKVLSFHEKPSFDVAKQYLENGNYFWNAGIVVVKAKKWREFLALIRPDILQAVLNVVGRRKKHENQLIFEYELFNRIPKESVDYAVLEKAVKYGLPMFVIPYYGRWSDLGTWKMVYSYLPKDCSGNVLVGDVLLKDCKDSYFYSTDRLLVGLGLNNVSVISTHDAILVLPTSESEQVKAVVAELTKKERPEVAESRYDVKPWGEAMTYYADDGECKLKRLVINPGQSISLQRHKFREEHWIVVSGKGMIVRGQENFWVQKGDYIYIPKGSIHRVVAGENEAIIIVEVQMGAKLSEDDIERLEDIYNRN